MSQLTMTPNVIATTVNVTMTTIKTTIIDDITTTQPIRTPDAESDDVDWPLIGNEKEFISLPMLGLTYNII
mgnify:CR=1 FL=1